MKLRLVEPTLDLIEEFQAFILEYKEYGEKLYYEMYKAALKDFDNYILSSSFWLINDENKILGVIRIRKSEIPERELPIAGNIGYDISPLSRKKGYGKIILYLGLEKARDFNLNRVMVNCVADNISSMKIIESNGGIFYNQVNDEFLNEKIKQYFIYLGIFK